MRLITVLSLILTIMLFSPMVFAQEIQYRGFGGVTAINPTGTLVWYDSLMRSTVLDDENLFLAYDMSSMNIDSEIYDFSGRNNHGNMSSDIGNFDNATFSPTDDTYARQDTPDSVNGAASVMDVSSWSLSTLNRRGFVEYDISSIPAGATVTFAEIVWERQTSSGSFPRNYDAQRVIAPWDESTLTWNNQPGTAGTNYTTAVTSSSSPDSWTITDIVEGWHNGTFTNYGVRVRDDTEDSGSLVHKQYYTKEFGAGAPDPVLEVTWGFPLFSIPLIASIFGQARDFDGYDDYVNTSIDISPDNFTLVAWVNADNLSSVDGVRGILNKRGPSAPTLEWRLFASETGNIRFQAWDSTPVVTVDVISSVTISLGSFYGIGLTYNGSTAQLWINGDEDNSADRTANRIENTPHTITIGEDATDSERYWDGPIDEVLIFTDVKTDLEMSYLTTIRQQVIIGGGSASVPQRYAGLILALPWLIVAGIMFTMFYIAFLAWRKSLKGEW